MGSGVLELPKGRAWKIGRSRLCRSNTDSARLSSPPDAEISPPGQSPHQLPSRILLSAVALSLIALTTFGQLPGSSKFYITLQNSLHAPMFAVLAIIFLRIGTRADGAPSLHACLWSWLSCLITGIAIEFIQSRLGGDASALDVFDDVLGATGALTAYASLHTRIYSARIGLRCVSVGAVLVAVAPLCFSLAAYANRALRFPTVAAFSSSLDLYFLEDRGGTIGISALPENLSKGKVGRALSVVLPQAHWPGIEIAEPSPDWSRYRTLNIEMANPGQASLPINIRVHDRAHNWRWEDRFNTSEQLPASSRHIVRLPLAMIECSPRGRAMDMRHIASIIIFTDAMQAGRKVFLVRVWLD